MKVVLAPDGWTKSCAHDECTLHQLSPYIGKIKSSIAGELVKTYSKLGDLVVDPFGGSGTTYAVCELKHRHWIGTEIDFAEDIKTRLETTDIGTHKNGDFVERKEEV